MGGARAAIVVRVVTGFAVAGFTVVVAAAATEAAITGSANPANWGQQVRQQVVACKAALETGEHGIGPCVSVFASQHGKDNSNRASGARLNHGNANGHNKGAGKANGKAGGKGNGGTHGQTSHKSDHADASSSDGAGD
jgi:hypothetical protein